MNATQPVAASASDAARVGFMFVQSLATELSSGKVDLAGFPEIVARVRAALADEDASTAKVARIIAAEPVLSARLLQTANSAALNASGKPVTDLNAAILRVGLNLVRSTTIAFAVQQLRHTPALRGLEKPLDLLWQRTVLVAALSYVLARRLTSVSPDTAMLAGMLQGIGRLYILSRAGRHRALFADVASYQAIERDWHLGIAVALLEHWGMAPEIVQAVRESEDFAREPRGSVGLSEVLVAATLIAVYQERPELLDARLQSVRPVARLQLTRPAREQLLSESAAEIQALRQLLG